MAGEVFSEMRTGLAGIIAAGKKACLSVALINNVGSGGRAISGTAQPSLALRTCGLESRWWSVIQTDDWHLRELLPGTRA